MQVSILVKSQSYEGEVYSVEFRIVRNRLRIACSCPAGDNALLCKHRRALVMGDTSMVIRPELRKQTLEQVQKLVAESPFPSLVAQLEQAEAAVVQAEHQVRRLKAKTSQLMTEGAPVGEGTLLVEESGQGDDVPFQSALNATASAAAPLTRWGRLGGWLLRIGKALGLLFGGALFTGITVDYLGGSSLFILLASVIAALVVLLRKPA